MAQDYSLECLPALLHFSGGDPTQYPGDLRYIILKQSSRQQLIIIFCREEKDVRKWIDRHSKIKSSD